MGACLRPEVLGSKGGRWARGVVGWACGGGKSRESIQLEGWGLALARGPGHMQLCHSVHI